MGLVICFECAGLVLPEDATEVSNTGVFICEPCWVSDVEVVNA